MALPTAYASRWHNPFFVRELRQMERRSWAMHLGLLLAFLLQTGPLLCGLWATDASPLPNSFMKLALLMPHATICSLAGAYGAYRIFVTEHLRGTLDALRLLPYTPWQWVWRKISFAVFLVLLCWVLAVPVYLLAFLYRVGTLDELLALAFKPLFAGLACAFAGLLLTPDTIRAIQPRNSLAKIRSLSTQTHLIENMLVIYLTFILLQAGMMIGEIASTGSLRWYVFKVSPSFLWLTYGSLYIAVTVCTACAALSADSGRGPQLTLLRTGSVTLLFYTAIGLLWSSIAPTYRWCALLPPVLLLLFRLVSSVPREDKRSPRETAWLAARWDNPLFVHDWRVVGRYASLYRSWKSSLILLLLLCGGLVVTLRCNPKFLTVVPQDVVILIGAQMGCMFIFAPWARASFSWRQEILRQTLPLILITPLPSREIVLGRLVSSPLYFLLGSFPLLAAPLGFYAIVFAKSFPSFVPLVVAISPLIFTVGVWIGCPSRHINMLAPRVWFGDYRSLLLRFLQLLVWAATVALGIAAISVPPPVVWVGAFAIGAANLALLWAWYHLRLRELDRWRQGDIDVPLPPRWLAAAAVSHAANQ